MTAKAFAIWSMTAKAFAVWSMTAKPSRPCGLRLHGSGDAVRETFERLGDTGGVALVDSEIAPVLASSARQEVDVPARAAHEEHRLAAREAGVDLRRQDVADERGAKRDQVRIGGEQERRH